MLGGKRDEKQLRNKMYLRVVGRDVGWAVRRPEDENRRSCVQPRVGRHNVHGTAHGVLASGTAEIEG